MRLNDVLDMKGHKGQLHTRQEKWECVSPIRISMATVCCLMMFCTPRTLSYVKGKGGLAEGLDRKASVQVHLV